MLEILSVSVRTYAQSAYDPSSGKPAPVERIGLKSTLPASGNAHIDRRADDAPLIAANIWNGFATALYESASR